MFQPINIIYIFLLLNRIQKQFFIYYFKKYNKKAEKNTKACVQEHCSIVYTENLDVSCLVYMKFKTSWYKFCRGQNQPI